MKKVLHIFLGAVSLFIFFVVDAVASDPNTFSRVVSYQFYDAVDADTNEPVISPIISYQYFDWPGDSNLTFQTSPTVSYLFIDSSAFTGSPVIYTQPLSQSVIANDWVALDVIAAGAQPLFYQWHFNDQNIPDATNATFTLLSSRSSDSGRYSVLIVNAFGSIVSKTASLSVLGGETYAQPVTRVPVPSTPDKSALQDSLIVVTHGYQPLGILADVSWVDDMAWVISNRLASLNLNNWRIDTCLWPGGAWPDPETALGNGIIKGALLGNKIGQEGWKHVHLIGHSAGSALIESAAERIKKHSPSTVIHTTFLDPFIGISTVGRLLYGRNSDWADSYYADDFTDYATVGKLIHAHSVNVTALDPNYRGLLCFDSSMSSANSTPTVLPHSSHSWPHEFYVSTVPPATLSGTEGYGYPLSKEGGGWASLGGYPTGNVPVALGATTCLPDNTFRFNNGMAFNFLTLPKATSSSGTHFLGGNGFNLTSGQELPLQQDSVQQFGLGVADLENTQETTAWLSCSVIVTDTVNFVACDVEFTKTDAEGLLTVYWNTNIIGTIDERTVQIGFHAYRFPLPVVVSSGIYSLGFRLDSFTNISSSATVTNVTTGFAGDEAPIAMSIANDVNGLFMTMTGPSNHNYLAYASSNLLDWSPFAILVNTNGTVRFFDPDTSNYKHRFYRIVRPQ